MTKNAVVYTVTGNYLHLTSNSMASLIRYYDSPEKLDIIVVTENLFAHDVQALKALPKMYQQQDKIQVSAWAPPALPAELANYQNERFPIVTLWRLFLPGYFRGYEHLLYLDNDTLIYRNIAPLFGLCNPNDALAAVLDINFFNSNQAHYQLFLSRINNLPSHYQYFNSGVLLFNVAKFNELYTSDFLNRLNQVFDAIHPLWFPDQDVLNLLTANHVTYLPLKYNYQGGINWSIVEQEHFDQLAMIKENQDQLVIRHFNSPIPKGQPWQHLLPSDQCERDFWQQFSAVRQFLATQTN